MPIFFPAVHAHSFLQLPNNIKIIEREKDRKRKNASHCHCEDDLHQWYNCLESSVPGVIEVGTRCQSTCRSQSVTAGGLLGGLRSVAEIHEFVLLSTNMCL